MTLCQGLLKVKSCSLAPAVPRHRALLHKGAYRYFVLRCRQQQQGEDDVEVRYTLLCFARPQEADELHKGAAVRLDGIEAASLHKGGGAPALTLRTADGELVLQACDLSRALGSADPRAPRLVRPRPP